MSNNIRSFVSGRPWWKLKTLLLVAAGLNLAAAPGFKCGGDAKKAGPKVAASPSPVPAGSGAELRQNIENLTGARTRIVWARDFGPGKDTFALGSNLVLMALDTQEPHGERLLAAEQGNYSRPLLSPDGEEVVYSRRTPFNAPVPEWSSTIYQLDWKGGNKRALRSGYAVDLWRDPDSGITWVYAFTSMRPGISSNPEGYRLFRFPLGEPTKEELIWDKGLMSGDNIQLNRSGKAASGLIPWPNAGTFDFTADRFVRYRNGCWPSLAPDDSGLFWVFDGTHAYLRFFIPGVDGNWRVGLGKSEGIKGKAVYHPRWSNHPRIMAFTGPHPVKVNSGSGKVSVVLGRFNEGLTALEESVNLRNPTAAPDCFPDVWVEGGELVNLDRKRAGPTRIRELAAAPPVQAATTWAPGVEGLSFKWERATVDNTIPDPNRECSVTPHGYARFGRRYQMNTQGGSFTIDAASAAAIRQSLTSGAWCMEMAVTPASPGNEIPQVIFRAGTDFELQQSHHDFIVRIAGREWQLGVGLSPGETTHLAIGSSAAPDKPPVVWINGQSQDVRPVEIYNRASLPPAESQEYQFGARQDGSAAWSGYLETIAIQARPFDARLVAAHSEWWKAEIQRHPAPAVTVVRARLKSVSVRATPEGIGAYRRSWTSGLYEKINVLSGPDPGDLFGVAHWTLMDGKALTGGPPGVVGEERELRLEPMAEHPEMDSEHGSEDLLEDGQALFLDVAPVGS